MNVLGWHVPFTRSQAPATMTLEQFTEKMFQSHGVIAPGAVTPENAERSPTVKAAVNAVVSRISTLPIEIVRTTEEQGLPRRERLPNHPVARLLKRPNDRLNGVTFLLDAFRQNMLHGEYIAVILRGRTGPVRGLEPVSPSTVSILQNDDLSLTYTITLANGKTREYAGNEILHVRGPSEDGIRGQSPVKKIRTAIALDITAEVIGDQVFQGAALPTLVMKTIPGADDPDDEVREKFMKVIRQSLRSRGGVASSIFLPKGIEFGDPITVDYEKSQFLQTRQYQRTVIAGAFNVPLTVVGDMAKSTFNNSEETARAFLQNTILPYIRQFEAAMEVSLLSDEDRRSGVEIRFDLDAAMRADFKSRQEGLKIQREMGVRNVNEWRALEGLNPIAEEDGGDVYWTRGPQGQGMDEEQNADDGDAQDDERPLLTIVRDDDEEDEVDAS